MSGPMPWGGAPFTSTRPSRIQRSASRRDDAPARARNWLSRTVRGRDLLLGRDGRILGRFLGGGRFLRGGRFSRDGLFPLLRQALALLQQWGHFLQLGKIGELVDPHVGEELLRGGVEKRATHALAASLDRDQVPLQQRVEHARGVHSADGI